MFLLDETGRFLYTKYGKSEEGVQTLGEKIIHGIHRFLEILEIVLAAIIVLVLVALMGIVKMVNAPELSLRGRFAPGAISGRHLQSVQAIVKMICTDCVCSGGQ